jgi:hypothetical protein
LHDNQDANMKDDEEDSHRKARPGLSPLPVLLILRSGKIDVDFDPDKVPMLSLQLDIEKDSTGFRQSARLSPLTTLGENAPEDEKVVVALQHSLFCASLFEWIRRELIPDEYRGRCDPEAETTTVMLWLSSAMEEHFFLRRLAWLGQRGEMGHWRLCIVTKEKSRFNSTPNMP